jgi:uncharacterized membrane protein YphA (DoxX/SURF4 family)
MTTEASSLKRSAFEVAAVLARWLLGACFLYMGWSKALDPYKFEELLRQYDVVANPIMLNLIASLLPWFEVFCGLLLLGGVAVRGSALVLIAMLAPFTLLVLRRALAVAAAKHQAFCLVKFDCGCGNGEVLICHKLVENSVLVLLACWLMLTRHGRLCWRFNLIGDPKSAS